MPNATKLRATALIVACLISLSAYVRAETLKQALDVPAGDLGVALQVLARQSGAELVYRPEQVRGLRTQGVHGEFSAEEAASQLLRGTALTLNRDLTGALLIATPQASSSNSGAEKTSAISGSRDPSQLLRLAQAAASSAETTAQPASPTGNESPASPAEEPLPLQEIVVSGSRIKRSTFETASPTLSVTSEDLEKRGAVDVLSVLEELPALRKSFGLEFRGGQADIGIQRANLHGFGTQRSLVVVNNRRRVSTATEADARGFVASSFDISNIPSALIDRVDVVTGGASSVYGSDAISGAINIILKNNFEGFEVGGTGGSGFSGKRDYYSAHLTAGHNFDRGNAVFHVEYAESQRLPRSALGGGYSDQKQNDRIVRLPGQNPMFDPSLPPDALIPFYNDLVDFSIPGDTDRTVYIPHIRAGGGGSALGSGDGFSGFFLPIDSQGNVLRDANGDVVTRATAGYDTGLLQRQKWGLAIYDPALGKLRAANLGTLGAVSSFECVTSSGCEIENYDYDLLIPSRRTNLYGSLSHEVASNVKFVGEVMYSRSFSSRNQNPSDPGFWFPSGFEPVSELFVDSVDANGNVTGQVKSPFFSQAFIDQIYEIDPSYNPASGQFIDDKVYVGIRQLNENGPRLNTYDRDYLTFSGGLQGQFSNGWSWETFFDWGRSSLVWTRFNDHEDRRLIAATDIIFDSVSQSFECRDATWRAEGCVPADLVNGISPDAVQFLTFDDVNVHSVTQQLASANLSGDSSPFFSLPAGPIKFALGAEWRRTNMRQDPGNGFVRGTTYGGESRPRFDVTTSFKEEYLEAVIPVVHDLPFAKLIELEGGARYSTPSVGGDSDVTWKAGGRWAPIEDIRFRGMLARAVRSPSGSELLQPVTRTFTTMVDPCDASRYLDSPANSATRLANCMALLGLSQPDALNFTGRPSNIASQSGNPALQSEVADTVTVGVVLAPRFLPSLTMSVDYYDIKIKDLISSIGVDNILEACVLNASGPNNQFCSLVQRFANKQIALVTNGGVNINSQEVKGIETQIASRFRVNTLANLFRSDTQSDLGAVTWRLTGGLQIQDESRFLDPTTGEVFVQDNIGLGRDVAPKVTVQNQFNYQYRNLSLFWNTFWAKSMKTPGDIEIPGAVYHDLSGTYDLPWSNAQVTLAVQNVLNEEGRLHPFTCCSPNSAFDRGRDSRTYAVSFQMSLGGK